MKTLARVAALTAVSILSLGAASAATLVSSSATTSYSGTVATDGGLTSTPVGTIAATNTAGFGVWSPPIAGSVWVSNNANAYPGGGVTPANGTYQFFTTFAATTGSNGTVTVMADDTTSVYLNGTLITNAAGPNPAAKCTVGTPNCTTPTTYNLTGFVNGTNYLTFNVHQVFNDAMGLDYSATINASAVPEPSSLMLLGTGLVGSAGMFFRRLRA